jgi:prepilin-type N-terminal cleavage/methylation domain-containing protein
MRSKGGFTLIELIVTVAIIAVLVAVLVVALNPAEQLARTRDAKRVADLDAMKTGLNLYLAQATGTINLDGNSSANSTCLSGGGTPTWYVNSTAITTSTGTGFSSLVTSTGQLVATSATPLAASTWMPALVGATPGGSPLPGLPLDPKGGTNATYYYAYACRFNKTYEFTARLESTYFLSDVNLDGTDGGNSSSTYEVGTDLSIIGPGF